MNSPRPARVIAYIDGFNLYYRPGGRRAPRPRNHAEGRLRLTRPTGQRMISSGEVP